MRPLAFIKSLFSKAPRQDRGSRRLRAGYEASKSGVENRNHWSATDELGPVSAHTTAVRGTLRKRCRYERDNNPHLNALLKTYGHNLIGTGPRLNLQLPTQYHESARIVEKDFAAWAKAVDLAEKLRLMAETRPVDGESFGRLVTNPLVPNAVKLDVRVYEAEQIATPDLRNSFDTSLTDGIEFDAAGNPRIYHVLREHPGDGWTFNGDADRVEARLMLHWFRPSRPGQTRGVCELASSLGIGAQTRRFSQAVLTKAEVNANVSGVMKTNVPMVDESGQPVPLEMMDDIEFPRGTMLTVPEGCEPIKFDNGSDTAGFGEYTAIQYTTLGRPLLMPRNLVTGDSSGFNFASGKLDYLPFYQEMWIERERLAARVLNQLFQAYYLEYSLRGLVPPDLPAINEWSWDWHWDGFPSINPEKDEAAREMRLANNVTTLAEECAGEGKNWRDVIDQRSIEREYMRSKGIDPDTGMKPMPVVQQVPVADDSEDDAPATNHSEAAA